MKKRSVLIAGHSTSISLEEAFWRELKLISKARNVSLNKIITEITTILTIEVGEALLFLKLERNIITFLS
mgnify:CR=1 FL=1